MDTTLEKGTRGEKYKTGEWEKEKINFINTVAKPDSIIESSNTTYSFFNMDLDKAKEAYEKTLL